MQPSKVEPITVTAISFVNTPQNMLLPANKRLIVVEMSNGTHQVTTSEKVTQQIMAIRNQQSQLGVALENSRLVVAAIGTLITPTDDVSPDQSSEVTP